MPVCKNLNTTWGRKCCFGWIFKAQGDLGRSHKASGVCTFWCWSKAAAVIVVAFLSCTLTCPDGVSSLCEIMVGKKTFSCFKNGIVLDYRRGNSFKLLCFRC